MILRFMVASAFVHYSVSDLCASHNFLYSVEFLSHQVHKRKIVLVKTA